MLSELPINLDAVDPKNLDKEILRVGMIAELDATSFYEQMADLTDNENIKEVLLDIAEEEKVHIGEFEALLMQEDSEQSSASEKGEQEVKEMQG